MKRISKTKTIARAFAGTYTASEEVIQERLAICATCPYNSANVEGEDMSFFNKVRSNVISSDFCTACGCQVFEKVTQANEECGAVEKGEKPKWNRLVAETTSNYLNLHNLSPSVMNVAVNQNYELLLGKPVNNVTKLRFNLESEYDFKMTELKPSCRSCTKVNFRQPNPRKVEVEVIFDKSRLKYDFNKKIRGVFYRRNKVEKIIINIKGKI